jgi:hypothetical protein
MDVSADRSTRTSAPRRQPAPAETLQLPRRRRPTGEAPPLPFHLQTSGVRWLIVRSSVMEEAGRWTRPDLPVWGGAPRRNRTGDPILTMEPPGTAVRNPVFAGRARPSGSKVSVLFRRSYAFAMTRLLSSRQTDHDRRLRSGASVSTMKVSSFPLVAPPVGWPLATPGR